MVYCGKPSKGCQSCRDRKTRCDKALPSCSQCIRANRPCPGYRSQLDLMFRNESTAVIDKAKSREKVKAKARSASSKGTPSHEPNAAPKSSDALMVKEAADSTARFKPDTQKHGMYVKTHLPNIPNLANSSLFPTLEERSLGYFTTHSSMWIRDFDLVDTICAEANATDQFLIASMSAVGLASFSHSVHAPELMIRARRDYGTALQLTNAALRNPVDVKKDSTLFAVMILGIFETVTGNNGRSLAAWTEHINGAAALVKLRGEVQFQTQAGQKLFLQVTSSLMLSCIQRKLPMPYHIIVLRKSAERFIDAENPAWQLTGIVIDLTVLRASIRGRITVDPREIIDAALEMDSRFVGLFTNLPEHWQYTTIYTEETPHLIWDGSFHVYPESLEANLWNAMRTCRIIIHEVIRNQLLLASYAPEPTFSISEIISQNNASEAIMIAMREDILGSVPHHTRSSSNEEQISFRLEGSRSYFVLWPLYLAGAMDLTSDEVRKWAVARLKDIGDTIGLRQAFIVAEYLESGKHIEAWQTEGPGGVFGDQDIKAPPRPSELKAFFEGLRERQEWRSVGMGKQEATEYEGGVEREDFYKY